MEGIDDDVLLKAMYEVDTMDDESLHQILCNDNWGEDIANEGDGTESRKNDEPKVKKEEKNETLCDSTQMEYVQNSSRNDMHHYPGEYNFNIVLQQNKMYKASWEFSEMYNQVFINLNKVMMVQFVFDVPMKGVEFFIRATPYYFNNDFADIPVKRCRVHSIDDDPNREAHSMNDECRCEFYNNVGHLIMCLTDGAIYDYDQRTKRHSVSVACVAGQTCRNSLSILYKFACKSSCQKGVNRSPITMMFTLENQNGEILGRASLIVKICSCPKRDKAKFENDFVYRQNRLVSSPSESPPKVSKMLKARITAEIKRIHKAKNMMETSLRNMENALDF